MTEKVDRKEIFPPATCSREGCISNYAKWCRHCNLVYCGIHIEDHPCKPEDRAAREKLYLSDLTDEQDPVEEPPCPPPL